MNFPIRFHNKYKLIYKIILAAILLNIISSLKAQTYDKSYVNSINLIVDYINYTSQQISRTYFIVSDIYRWGAKDKDTNIVRKFSHHYYRAARKSKFSDSRQYAEVYVLKTELNQNNLIRITDSLHLIYKKIIDCTFETKTHIERKMYMKDDFKHYLELASEADYLYHKYHVFLIKFRKELDKIAENLLKADYQNPEKKAEMIMRKALDYQLPLLYKWEYFMNGSEFPLEAVTENTDSTNIKFINYNKNPGIDKYLKFHYNRFYSYLEWEQQKKKKKAISKYKADSLFKDSKFVPWGLISAFGIRCVREHNIFVTEASKIGIYMIKYPLQPYYFIKDAEKINLNEIKISTNEPKTKIDSMYISMEGYAINHLILLLDVSASMKSEDKLLLFIKSFKRLLTILRKEDKLSLIIFSGTSKIILEAISCSNKNQIIKELNNLKGGGTTNINAGLNLAYQNAEKNYIKGGNNRIIIATDGKFSVDNKLFKKANKYGKKNIFLSIFQFNDKMTDRNLIKLATKGHGNYEKVNKNNIAYKLITEAKSIKLK